MAGLPPATRLRRAADFAALRQAQGRLRGLHVLLRWNPGASTRCRLGLAVSRKVSKRAVVRNRIKRVTREAFRAARADLPALDVLVIAQASAALIDARSLRADLDAAWDRLRTLKRAPAPGTIAD